MPDGQSKAVIEQGQTLKNVVCTSCDGFCPVAVKVDEGQAVKVTTRDHPLLKDVLCMKGLLHQNHLLTRADFCIL